METPRAAGETKPRRRPWARRASGTGTPRRPARRPSPAEAQPDPARHGLVPAHLVADRHRVPDSQVLGGERPPEPLDLRLGVQRERARAGPRSRGALAEIDHEAAVGDRLHHPARDAERHAGGGGRGRRLGNGGRGLGRGRRRSLGERRRRGERDADKDWNETTLNEAHRTPPSVRASVRVHRCASMVRSACQPPAHDRHCASCPQRATTRLISRALRHDARSSDPDTAGAQTGRPRLLARTCRIARWTVTMKRPRPASAAPWYATNAEGRAPWSGR